MELQEVEVFIGKDGQIRVEVSGVKGMACLDVTKDLENAIGGQIQERTMRHEAYSSTTSQIEEELLHQAIGR